MTFPKWKSALITLTAILPASPALADNDYAAGQAAAAEYRYGEALVRFRMAAGLGHAQAQLIAGGMLLFCDRLYGTEVPCDKTEALKWLRLAADQGSEVSHHLLRHIGAASGSVAGLDRALRE